MTNQQKLTEILDALDAPRDRKKAQEIFDVLNSVNAEKSIDALKALIQISSEYKATTLHTFNDSDGRYERVSESSTKLAMRALQPLLEKLSGTLERIPISDMSAFNTIMYELQTRHIHNPERADDTEVSTIPFHRLINEAYKATEEVINEQKNHTPDSTDKHRSVVAYKVALVIQNILESNVATTLDSTLLHDSKPTAALYCRVLRMTLALTGDISFDMQKLMTAGIALSNDASLPH